MLDGQAVLHTLKEKQAKLAKELDEIKAEIQRLSDKEAVIGEKLKSFDVVIESFDGETTVIEAKASAQISEPESQNGNAPDTVNETPTEQNESESEPFELQPKVNGHKPKRIRGLKETARKRFNELPNQYTKEDVAEILTKEYPQLNGTVNDNTLTGIMRDLVDLGKATIKTPSTGKTKQVYEKV